jgi:ElaA protein
MTSPGTDPLGRISVSSFSELDNATLYALLQLRVDVFVVEQRCAYPELDGRDIEQDTRHFWSDDGTGPDAYLRVLDDGQDYRIGRVCTRSDARGSGRAADLMRAALSAAEPDRGHVLDAQSHLSTWYEGFGFVVDGAEFIEDGIPHVPMRRRPTPAGHPKN